MHIQLAISGKTRPNCPDIVYLLTLREREERVKLGDRLGSRAWQAGGQRTNPQVLHENSSRSEERV